MLVFDEIYFHKEPGRHRYWDARVGCIDIAHIIGPRKGERDYYIVRLTFVQERGSVDFTKDKHVATLEEAKRHILVNFRLMLRKLCLNYDIVKWKNCKKKII